MSKQSADLNIEAKHAAFELAFDGGRSPLPYERWTDEELLPKVKDLAPTASPEECLDALSMVRRLCDDVYEVCETFRSGEFGEGTLARQAALRELSIKSPGFTGAEYDTAFSAGLLWTAF